MPCFIHSSGRHSALLSAWASCRPTVLLCKGYLLEFQYFRKIQSQSPVKIRRLNTYHIWPISRSAGLSNRSSGLFAIFVYTSLLLIPTSNMRLYLKVYLQNVYEKRTQKALYWSRYKRKSSSRMSSLQKLKGWSGIMILLGLNQSTMDFFFSDQQGIIIKAWAVCPMHVLLFKYSNHFWVC